MHRFTMVKCILAVTLMALRVFPPSAQGAPLTYPATKKIDQTDTYFGHVVSDPYRWLEDDNAADTKAWVTAQNKLTFDYLAAIPFRDAVLQRVTSLMNYTRFSAPFRKRDDIFFYKNDGLQNQPVLYRQKGLGGTPEVLLDPNSFSADGTIGLTSFNLRVRL